MVSDAEALAIKTRIAPQLLALPGVTAVGLGSKEIGGRPTGELVLKVFVTVKRDAAEVAAAELIPDEVDGLRTDVVQSGRRHLVTAPPGGLVSRGTEAVRSRPLIGGRRIQRESSTWSGTMGCFLVDPHAPGSAWGLTNQHVLDVPDVPTPQMDVSPVGQPSGKFSVTDCCSDIIGKYAGGEEDDDGQDEAAVKLDPGTQWLAEIVDIGIVTGTHAITTAEATPQTYPVRKRGSRTLLTGGVVRSVETSDGHSDNDIVIAPNPNPAAGTRTVFFAYEGDSGSALVNDAGEVTGLVYSRDDSGNAYAYAISHVLERLSDELSVTLEVAVATTPGVVNTVPGAAMVATPAELAPVLGAAPRPAPASSRQAATGWALPIPRMAAPMMLQRDLDRSETGRLVITAWLNHQRELLRLIDANRRVAVAWHRSGLAALVQILIRMPDDPELALPTTLHGAPVRGVLTAMRATLDRFASPDLSADLARVDRALPDLGGLTYPQIIAAFGTG